MLHMHALTPFELVKMAYTAKGSQDWEALTIRKLQMASGCDGYDLGHSEKE